MKKFFKLSNLKSILISLFLMLSVFFVSACAYSDRVPTEEEGGTTFIAGINGFKINYRPEIFEVSDFYYNFSYEVVSTLSQVFGNADFDLFRSETVVVDGVNVIPFIYNEYLDYLDTIFDEDEIVDYKVFEQAKTIYFIDDIRNSIYISENTQEEAELKDFLYFSKHDSNEHFWKWTHKIEEGKPYGYPDFNPQSWENVGLFLGDYQNSPKKATSVFNLYNDEDDFRNERINYYNFYAETYAKALQVAILEILLERQPTQFAFDFSLNQVLPNPEDLLGNGITSGLKLDYKKYVEYVGISQTTAVPEITNYLLENVIGQEKYNSNDNNFDRDDYQFLIEELIWRGTLAEYNFSDEEAELVNQSSLGSIYNIYPAFVIEDFPAYSLFVQSQDSKAFAHIPAGQYRSIVLMPSKTDYLFTIMFYLAAAREFNINMHYRYYDAEKDLLFESVTGTAKTYIENQFSFSNSEFISLLFENEQGNETLYKMTQFNNNIGNGILKADQPKKMNYALNEYFEESLKGGFGLNHLKFKEDNSSFFEIIFNVDSAQQELDTSFKVGIQGVWAADPNDFN